MLNRKVELGFKLWLFLLLLLKDCSENQYDYYINEMMIEFWKEFIELKQFARIAKKFSFIVKKEGGREFLQKEHYDGFMKKEKSEKLKIVYIVKLIAEWEEKYKW
jgi:hypothetical protein